VPPPRPKPVFSEGPYVAPEPIEPMDPAAALAARREAFEAKRSQAVEQAQAQLHARLMKEQRRRESQPPPAATARPPPLQPQQPSGSVLGKASGSVLGKAPPPSGPKPAASWLAKHLALPIPAAKPSKSAATPAAAGEKSVAAPQLVAPSPPTPSHALPPPAAAAAATAEPSAVETQLAQLDAAAKLAREAKESARVLAAHRQRQAKPEYQAMQKVRATLPAFSLRESIVEAVREHQVREPTRSSPR
jgi:HrpA-like RNA helicase